MGERWEAVGSCGEWREGRGSPHFLGNEVGGDGELGRAFGGSGEVPAWLEAGTELVERSSGRWEGRGSLGTRRGRLGRCWERPGMPRFVESEAEGTGTFGRCRGRWGGGGDAQGRPAARSSWSWSSSCDLGGSGDVRKDTLTSSEGRASSSVGAKSRIEATRRTGAKRVLSLGEWHNLRSNSTDLPKLDR